MSSQLNVDTIVDKAGSSGPSLPNTTTIKISNTSTYVSDGGAVTQNTIQSLTKAWCTVDENSTVTVRDGFNNSSVTDNSTANTSFTMTLGTWMAIKMVSCLYQEQTTLQPLVRLSF